MKTLEEYLKLPYHIRMVRDVGADDPEPAWVVWVDELPGCMSQGDSPEDAAEMIQEAMHAWLAAMIEAGDPIPEPRPESSHSGRFMVRLPRSLHAALDDAARHEGVSLNQYVTTVLAGAVGFGLNQDQRKAG